MLQHGDYKVSLKSHGSGLLLDHRDPPPSLQTPLPATEHGAWDGQLEIIPGNPTKQGQIRGNHLASGLQGSRCPSDKTG